MVDVNGGYHTHGHHRSLSSLASSIMPITSDTSTTTSLTASPIDPSDPKDYTAKPIITSNSERDGEQSGRLENEVPEREQHPASTGEAEEYQMPKDLPLPHDRTEIGASSIAYPAAEAVPWPILIEQAQKERFEKWRWTRLEKEVARLRFTNGLKKRLQDTSSIAYGHLIDQFKGDDQAGFTGLYEASERLSSLCESSQVSLEKRNSNMDASSEGQYETFQVTTDNAESILSFLNRLRSDLDYLSDLIANLPSQELSSLTSCYHPAGVDLSILPNHSHGRTSAYSRDSQMMKLSRRMDNIDLFHNKDPYFALLHTVFDSHAEAGSQEDRLRHEVWARTCARVVTDGKDGSEEFIIATIDSFISTDDWLLNTDLELYILDVLAEGWFVLDPPVDDSPEAPGTNWEPERASHAIAVAEFFDRHAEKLLAMLAAEDRTPIPSESLDFIRLVLSHIKEPQTRDLAKKFIVSRWYFASFITSLLVYPEVRGLCLDHHIGHSARQKILHRLALHIQSQVFSVLAPNALTYILPEVREQIFTITEQFDPSGKLDSRPRKSDTLHHHLMMSPWDVIGLVESLRPESLKQERRALSRPATSSSDVIPQTTAPSSKEDTIPFYEDSLSTESTYVDDTMLTSVPGNFTDSQPQSQSGKSTAPIPNLDRAIAGLRSSALGLARDRPEYTSKDWIHFRIDPKDSHLYIDSTSSRHFDFDTSTTSRTMDCALQNQESEYQASREAIKSLLSDSTDERSLRDGARYPVTESLPSFAPLLEDRTSDAKARHQFQDALTWSRRLAAYKALEQKQGSAFIYSTLSCEISHSIEKQISKSRDMVKELEDLLADLDERRRRHSKVVKRSSDRQKALRIKMWYSSDVKNSGPYEDALRVTRALRAMAQPKKPKQTTGFASWARQRLRGTNTYDRADKQALETMCASNDEGGLTKLGDDQIDLTMRWTSKSNIESLCQSEERIHRFLYEIQKLVQKLAGTSLLEPPVLWSSHFFRKEKRSFDGQVQIPPPMFTPSPVTPPLGSQAFSHAWSSPQRHRTAATDRLRASNDSNGLQITSYPHSAAYATIGHTRHDGHRSVLPTHGYLSPPMTPLSPRPVENFSPTTPNRFIKVPKAKQDFVDGLKSRLLALINSDLGYLLWAMGSETDAWIRKVVPQLDPAGASIEVHMHDTDQQLLTLPQSEPLSTTSLQNEPDNFSFNDSYKTILSTMSLAQDPRKKLETLSSLQDLVFSSYSTEEQHTEHSKLPPDDQTYSTQTSTLAKTTNQCTKRYTSSVRQARSGHQTILPKETSQSQHITFPPSQLIDELQRIFSNPSLRPPTLFRDLQTIASLTTSNTLDHTSEGSAFWTASIAALSLKDTLISKVIARAQAITEYHLSIRATHPPLLPPATHTDKDSFANTTLKDAADLWLIGAKEGHPVAARELALFYLTHPELVKRTTAPMTKSREVFGASAPNGAGGAALDPKTFCVVLHWMEVAASGGDRQAIDFLKENNGKKA